MSRETASLAEKGRVLLAIARATLVDDLGGQTQSVGADAEWLTEPGACFVTLHRNGELRGCIGSMLAYRTLLEDLRANTRAAAFRDPRFSPVELWELADLDIEVSLLSALEAMDFESEEDLLEQLRPGVDGLLLEYGGHRGTFLPAVWRNLPSPASFLGKLKLKAGLAEDFWSPNVAVQRYVTHSWSELDPVD